MSDAWRDDASSSSASAAIRASAVIHGYGTASIGTRCCDQGSVSLRFREICPGAKQFEPNPG